MHARAAVLPAGDVVAALGQIEHVPAERTQLACPQPMAEGQEGHGRVAMRGTCANTLLRGGDQALDLLRGEVLAGAPLGVGEAPRMARSGCSGPSVFSVIVIARFKSGSACA